MSESHKKYKEYKKAEQIRKNAEKRNSPYTKVLREFIFPLILIETLKTLK